MIGLGPRFRGEMDYRNERAREKVPTREHNGNG